MSKKGFTLVEVLLSLSITLLIVLNCSLLVKVLKISNQSKYQFIVGSDYEKKEE